MKYIETKKISQIMCVPTCAEIALDTTYTTAFPESFKKMCFTGDTVEPRLLDLLIKKSVHPIRIFNLYGQTEAPHILVNEIDPHSPERANCFSPSISENEIRYIALESSSNNVAILGVVGDVLCSGYLNEQGELHLPLNEEKIYSTGDLFRITDRKLCYVGRKDHRINWCGYRIEPREIELAILNQQSISAVRLYVDDPKGKNELVCEVESLLGQEDTEKTVRKTIRAISDSELSEDVTIVQASKIERVSKIR